VHAFGIAQERRAQHHHLHDAQADRGVLVAVAAHGRPLGSGGAKGSGLPAAFWDYVFTTFLILVLLLALVALIQAAGVFLLSEAGALAFLIAYVAVYGAAFGAVSPLRAPAMADQFGRRAYGSITSAQGVPVALAAASKMARKRMFIASR